MEVRYNGEIHTVTGYYLPSIPGRQYYADGSGQPDEPADFVVESVIMQTCNEAGETINIDVTDQLADNRNFIDICIINWEDYYAD